MPKNRRGSQNPTTLIKRPYKAANSKGPEAVEIYEKSGRKAQRWQALLLRHILADELLLH